MRTALLVLTACGAIAAMPALAGGSPYCIKGCDFDAGLGDCSFSTYQQCLCFGPGGDLRRKSLLQRQGGNAR
jgi:hypothetical protein